MATLEVQNNLRKGAQLSQNVAMNGQTKMRVDVWPTLIDES
jgi:hypothetical protein